MRMSINEMYSAARKSTAEREWQRKAAVKEFQELVRGVKDRNKRVLILCKVCAKYNFSERFLLNYVII